MAADDLRISHRFITLKARKNIRPKRNKTVIEERKRKIPLSDAGEN